MSKYARLLALGWLGLGGVFVMVYLLSTGWWYPVPDDSQVIISLERGMCHGTCPIYRVTAYGNGTVLFEGERYVGITGVVKSRIDPDVVAQLMDEISRSGYFKMKDEYPWYVRGVASVSVYVANASREKRIKHPNYYAETEFSAPLELFELEGRVDKILNSEKWINACGLSHVKNCFKSPMFWYIVTSPLFAALFIINFFVVKRKALLSLVGGVILGTLPWVIFYVYLYVSKKYLELYIMRNLNFYPTIIVFEMFILVLFWVFVSRKMLTSNLSV